MRSCELIQKCTFFNDKIKNMPNDSEWMKEKYCLGDNRFCARYKIGISFGEEKVPVDLFPLELVRANEIISDILLARTGFSIHNRLRH